jgi:hypothetical protein
MPAQPAAPIVAHHEPVAMAVAPAPDADITEPAPANTPATPTFADTTPEAPVVPANAAPQPTKPLDGPRAPVALITVTVLVMLVLSGIAVLVYVTSKP